MSECLECGSQLAADESFCGNCGTQRLASKKSSAVQPASDAAVEPDSETTVETDFSQPEEFKAVKSDSLGGSSADNHLHTSKPPARKGTTGGRQPTIKQLDPGTVLNTRYEIVRRIGGGGMGAVYLAKDRNLGDAPRAVKEMVEAHLDPVQHEKAIGDFKRESLLLT